MTNRIYVTGDTHGVVNRFSSFGFPEGKELDKNDYVVILGDFGLIWDAQESAEERYWLNWLEDKPWTTLFVDGNHEHHKRLNSFPVEKWNGGSVHKIRPHVIHLMRGQVFEIADRRIFTFGGAQSVDVIYRIKDVSWWEEELPSEDEMRVAEENLAANDYSVDYVFTHSCPTYLAHRMGWYDTNDVLSNFLQKIVVEGNLQFDHWFFGHYHSDEDFDDPFTKEKKYSLLYHDIVRIK